MNDPTPNAGASDEKDPVQDAPTKQKAFPDPSDLPPTHSDQLDKDDKPADTDVDPDSEDKPRSARDEALDRIYGQSAENVEAEIAESVEAGLQAAPEPIEEPDPEPEPEQVPEEVANVEGLGEFAVMVDGKPMFKTVVGGEEKFIPFAEAQESLQKEVAVGTRFRQVAEAEKTLKAREDALLVNERALDDKLKGLADSPPSAPADAGDQGQSDEEIAAEAKDLAAALMTSSEDEVAEKLTNFITKNRAPAQQTPVNEDEIARKAAVIARQEMTNDELEKDIKSGYKTFGDEYPELMENEALFQHANALSDEIAAEFPEYKPSQVMLEAGKRTQEWVASLKGESTEPPPEDPTPNNDRQSRKDNLVPMPRAVSGVVPDKPEEDQPDTPQSIMNEVRSTRGQA